MSYFFCFSHKRAAYIQIAFKRRAGRALVYEFYNSRRAWLSEWKRSTWSDKHHGFRLFVVLCCFARWFLLMVRKIYVLYSTVAWSLQQIKMINFWMTSLKESFTTFCRWHPIIIYHLLGVLKFSIRTSDFAQFWDVDESLTVSKKRFVDFRDLRSHCKHAFHSFVHVAWRVAQRNFKLFPCYQARYVIRLQEIWSRHCCYCRHWASSGVSGV